MQTTYKDIIRSKIDNVYHNNIANKILQYMDRVRNMSDLSQARRWGMELLQNCGDVAYENTPVNVRITLTEDKLLFEHNGKPFRVEDILSIINQTSSKNPDEKTVGHFGTGFMTTFQLSEVVEISSVLSDKTEDGALPYRPFKVTLDRRGHSKEDILKSIAKSMSELENVDESEPETEFNPRAFNTRFTYFLNCEEGRICARTGVSDLKNTILCILLFSPTIASVEIIDKIGGEHTTFERGFSVTSRTETEVVLLDTANQKRAVVSLGDSGNYTQRGWDVRVKVTENQQEKCEFYEVKTHTISSAVSNRILLSPSQMQFAMSHKNEYTVALVSCTRKTLECTGMRLYTDIPELIGNGAFVGEDNFSFYVKN